MFFFKEIGGNDSKFYLNSKNALNIYNSLKTFDEDNVETLEIMGKLVAVDTDKNRFGLITHEDIRIDGKYSDKDQNIIKDKFQEMCKVRLTKTKKFNSVSEEQKDFWELIDFLD